MGEPSSESGLHVCVCMYVCMYVQQRPGFPKPIIMYFSWSSDSHSRIKDRSLVQEVESHSQSLFTLADYIYIVGLTSNLFSCASQAHT